MMLYFSEGPEVNREIAACPLARRTSSDQIGVLLLSSISYEICEASPHVSLACCCTSFRTIAITV